MKELNLFFLVFFSLLCCAQKADLSEDTNLYFPAANNLEWETVSLSELGWNQNAVQPLKEFLMTTHTKSFMVLVNGKIAIEFYFDRHGETTSWPWNSAGKTLVSAMVGIAQQEGFLNIDDKVSNFLGIGWSNEPVEKENLIKIRHLLTMTSGLEDINLVSKSRLRYKADAGVRWSYSNVFTLLREIVTVATHQDFDTYFDTKLKKMIGMEGYWNDGLVFSIYHSNIRSMARFGLLALNHGKWNRQQIIDSAYFSKSINSSQLINPSYGYFWWLNGKGKYMLPGSQKVYQGELVDKAPQNMFSAMGAKDQRIYVVPEKKMVIVRMGESSSPIQPRFALSGFDNSLWEKINAVIQ